MDLGSIPQSDPPSLSLTHTPEVPWTYTSYIADVVPRRVIGEVGKKYFHLPLLGHPLFSSIGFSTCFIGAVALHRLVRDRIGTLRLKSQAAIL